MSEVDFFVLAPRWRDLFTLSSPQHVLIGDRRVVPEVSAGHSTVAVADTAGAREGIVHWDHQGLLGILWDSGRVDELMLLLLLMLGRPLPLLWHLLVGRRGVHHHGSRGHCGRLLGHVHRRKLQEK